MSEQRKVVARGICLGFSCFAFLTWQKVVVDIRESAFYRDFFHSLCLYLPIYNRGGREMKNILGIKKQVR